MAIKALFLSGNQEVLTDSLYQWDYGQELEIEAVDLGSGEVEIHFACQNMTEAIVRPCYLTDGIGVVTIPDDCLEQSSLITAWVYEIAGTQGRTRKVVKIPVISRTRPHIGRDIPTEICDRYTELITEVNTAIGDLKNGNIVVKNATTAETANSATTAGNASTANYAVSATHASESNSAKVLTPEELLTPDSDRHYYPIVEPGVYAVIFNTKHTTQASALIAVPDLGIDVYGTDTMLGQPVYEESYGRLSVYLDGETLPIVTVYKVANL